jgi:hypothetical protein
VDVCPTDLQVAPILTAELAEAVAEVKMNARTKPKLKNFLISQAYIILGDISK